MQRVQCIDIGNSTSKFGVFEDEILSYFSQFKTKDLISNPKKITSKISFENGNVIYCSVVPAAEDSIMKELLGFSGDIHAISTDFCADIPICYKNKKEIGADRIANAIAAYSSLDLPAVVIDLGTATTFDIVSKIGGYEGGIILPGPQGFLDFLEKNTALLPVIDLSKESTVNSPFGKSTKDAMLLGVFIGYKKMIHGIIDELKGYFIHNYGKKPTFVICGGSKFDLNFEGCKYIEHLTLHGLRIAHDFHYKKFKK